MTNKMPVVGKRYRNKRHQTFIVVESIKDGWITTKGFCKIQLSDFWHWFEKLPEDNLQETEKATVIFQTPDEPSLGFNSPTWSDVGTDSVDLEKGEVSEVERALEELKAHLNNRQSSLYCITGKLEDLAQNLVNALEAERNMSKPEPKIDMKEECVKRASIWKLTKEEIYRCNFSSYQIWLYEIFINSFEQMQKDIEEIKRNRGEGK